MERFTFVPKEFVEEIHDRQKLDAKKFNNKSNFEFMFSQIKNYLESEDIKTKSIRESTVLIASYYFFHLAAGHCFNDGNKRTAFITVSTFLILNGHMANYDEDKVEKYLKQINKKIRKGETISNALKALERNLKGTNEFQLIHLLFGLAGAGNTIYKSPSEILSLVDKLIVKEKLETAVKKHEKFCLNTLIKTFKKWSKKN